MSVLLLVLMSLATYRLTRLVVADIITQPVRNRLARWAYKRGTTEWFGDLIQCHWCTSVWVGAGVTALTALVVDLPYPLLVWAGVTSVGGLLCQVDEILMSVSNRLDIESRTSEE